MTLEAILHCHRGASIPRVYRTQSESLPRHAMARRDAIVTCVSVWENIPTSVKQNLRPPQRLKQAHVTRICTSDGQKDGTTIGWGDNEAPYSVGLE